MTEKRISNRAAILELLRDGLPHSQMALLSVGGLRYGARLYDLRRMGHTIDTINTGDDKFYYRLVPTKQAELDLGVEATAPDNEFLKFEDQRRWIK